MARSSGASHIASQPWTVPSTREMSSRDSGLPPNTRNSTGILGNVFESLLARELPPSAPFENPKNLASSSCGLRRDVTGGIMVLEREMRREPRNSSISVPRFQKEAGVFDHTDGTYSHIDMMDYRGGSNKLIAKSIDQLVTSRSIVKRNDFSDYDTLDAMSAPALKRLLDKHVHFRRRASVEEQRAQKYDRFLRGRQIACMICEHYRATGAYEAVQGLLD